MREYTQSFLNLGSFIRWFRHITPRNLFLPLLLNTGSERKGKCHGTLVKLGFKQAFKRVNVGFIDALRPTRIYEALANKKDGDCDDDGDSRDSSNEISTITLKETSRSTSSRSTPRSPSRSARSRPATSDSARGNAWQAIEEEKSQTSARSTGRAEIALGSSRPDLGVRTLVERVTVTDLQVVEQPNSPNGKSEDGLSLLDSGGDSAAAVRKRQKKKKKKKQKGLDNAG